MSQRAEDRENDGNQRERKREKLLNGYFADGANNVIRMPSDVVNLPNGNLGVSEVFICGSR
jgi:hypothetical protein